MLLFYLLFLLVNLLQFSSVEGQSNAGGAGPSAGKLGPSNNLDSNYDYIVVGAGAAGSMVAMGLADKGFKVLLMEAGPDYMSPNITTPALHVVSTEDENMAWDYYVKHYSESTNLRQKVLYPRASAIGGCTLHNAMIHLLPNGKDFQNMVDLTGDESWSYSHFQKYYQKLFRPNALEKLAPMKLFNQVGSFFQSLSTTATNTLSDKNKAWFKLSSVNIFNLLAQDKKLSDLTFQILGKPLLADILGFDINGFLNNKNLATDQEKTFLVPMNADPTQNLKRTGVYEKLVEFRKSGKLTIWTDTLATQILLDKQNTAYGVKYLSGKYLYKASPKYNKNDKGKAGVVYASKEIIVSAGTFNTPQLMMLSGIGDPDHLKEFNIQPRVNLPGVGRNLHDRYEISVNVKFDEKFKVLGQCLIKGDDSDPCYARFKKYHNGPYAFNGVLTGQTLKSDPQLDTPDLFIVSAPIYFSGYHHGMAEEVYLNKDILTFLILKAHSFNRNGRITLSSNDPRDTPNINFNYFSQGADKDLPAIIHGIKHVREMLKKFTNGFSEVIPGDHVQTDQDLAKYILNSAWGHHATGTMKIGTDKDSLSVLDSQFRVKGANKLRVVDFSVLPNIPGYFPVMYLYMIGAKAADTIAADA